MTKLKDDSLERRLVRYQNVIQGMDRGFALHEMLYDANGKPNDYRFLDVNQSFEEITGLSGVVGKTVLEVIPNLDSSWIEKYGKIADAGEPQHFEQFSAALNRHYEVWAYSPERHHFVAIFADITARKQAEGELAAALENVKALSGLLPICSFCKKIRNDDGYWEDVSIYIEAHSDADLSHGICEDCMRRHYPEVEITGDGTP